MEFYHEMTDEDIERFVKEHEAYKRWEKACKFIKRLYGDQAKKLWIDANKGEIYGIRVYGADDMPLELNFDAPFWSEIRRGEEQTWMHWLEYRLVEATHFALENNPIFQPPTKESVAYDVLRKVYPKELEGCLHPGKNYDDEWENDKVIDYDVDKPPVVTFPKIFASGLLTEQDKKDILAEARAVEEDHYKTNYNTCESIIRQEISGIGYAKRSGEKVYIPDTEGETYEGLDEYRCIIIHNNAFCYYGNSARHESESIGTISSIASHRAGYYAERFSLDEFQSQTGIEHFLLLYGIIPGDSLFTGSPRRRQFLREFYELLMTLLAPEEQKTLRALEQEFAAKHLAASAVVDE